MKNANLYIHPKAKQTRITLRNHSPKVTITKTKRNDVPPMYRRDWKRNAHRVAVVVFSALAILYCITNI